MNRLACSWCAGTKKPPLPRPVPVKLRHRRTGETSTARLCRGCVSGDSTLWLSREAVDPMAVVRAFPTD